MRSVLTSSFEDFEILVIDDASTDDGPRCVAAMTDPRLRLIRCECNGGRPAAANRGFAEARGEYIAVLDADDVMRADRLEKQLRFLDSNPEVGVVGSSLSVLGSDEGTMHWSTTDQEAKGKLLFSDPVCYGTSMFRRSVIEKHGVRCDEQWLRPGMDYLFLLRLAAFTRFSNIREPLTAYRIGPQNMRHGRDVIEDRIAIYSEAFRILGIDATIGEVRCQLMLHSLWKQAPGRSDVLALWAWVLRLKQLNRERGLFTAGIFEAELDRRWRHCFHAIADASFLAGVMHLRLSGSLDLKRLRYLMLTSLRRLRERRA